MSSRAIVPVSTETWQVIQSVAPVAQASRMFGVTQEQAAIVMLKGHELGLGLASAFEFVHVIDQRPSLSPKGALALIHNSGQLDRMDINDQTDAKGDPMACTVMMRRKSGFEYTVTFSMADAERAGLVKSKSGWEKYPANMLKWRAVGYCADVVFADICGGMLRPEELGADVDEEGEPVEATWRDVTNEPKVAPTPEAKEETAAPAAPEPQTKEEAPEELTLTELISSGWTAEQILVVNEGRIPSTQEELQAVKEKLGGADG